MSEEQPVTVIVHRRVKSGRQREFEDAMREFIGFALAHPGHSEIHVLQSSDPASRDYTVVDKFKDCEARQSFKSSERYQKWMERLGGLTEGVPDINEMRGLAGWFVVPGEHYLSAPPNYKMAVVTFLGVYPLTSLLPWGFSKLLPSWNPLILNLLVTSLIVAALTWVIMPLLTKAFEQWLYKDIAKEDESKNFATLKGETL